MYREKRRSRVNEIAVHAAVRNVGNFPACGLFRSVMTRVHSNRRFPGPPRFLAICTFVLTGIAMPAPARAEDCGFKTPPDITISKELLMTDLSVVNDVRANGPDGAWSFGHLMTAMAPGNDAGERVKGWLRSWETASRINGFAVDARPAIPDKIARPWMAKDGATSFETWTPNLANAPFRLLAIVYRPDLGIVTKDNTIANAGEARLVFSALDLNRTTDLDRAPPLPFTLIFEYALPASNREQVKTWAERWHALGRLPFGATYNEALERITHDFDGSTGVRALARLRTNEGLGFPWQLREFHLDPHDQRLIVAPVSNTPDLSLISQADALSAYINDNRGDDIPTRFIGGRANMPDGNFRWPRMAIANNVLRHNFAMLTCNGCHAAETGRKADDTGTADDGHSGFRHISGRDKDAEATLSEFLTGNPAVVTDPTGKLQTFCDLKMRQKAMFEALHPLPAPAATASHPDDLSVARSRKDRTD